MFAGFICEHTSTCVMQKKKKVENVPKNITTFNFRKTLLAGKNIPSKDFNTFSNEKKYNMGESM